MTTKARPTRWSADNFSLLWGFNAPRQPWRKKKSTRKHWKRNKTQHNYASWGGRAMNAWSGCYVSGRLDENTTRPARWTMRRITCAMRAHASKSAGVKIELRGQNTYHEITFIYAKSERIQASLRNAPLASLTRVEIMPTKSASCAQRQPCMQIKCCWSHFRAS